EGADPNCRSTFRDTLEIFCEPRASFSGFQSVIQPNDIMQLVATGTGNFIWLVNGIQVGSGPTFNYSNAQPGSAIIQLIKDNGICSDTSAGALVKVGNCVVDETAQKMHWALDVNYMLDFDVNPPAITANASRMKGTRIIDFIENSISISDSSGRLLFYCNGDSIWDSNHQPMPNGSDMAGSPSTVEATFAFRDPGGNPDMYYLITLDAFENRYRDGLSYSKIDMSLRGGLGDVVVGEKNRLIKITNNERFACVYHANGRDVWITASVNNGTASNPVWELESFLVDASGVSTTPVVSPGITSANGFLKFSHDGNWLFLGNLSGTLCRFDASTGIASTFGTLSASSNQSVFGAEFSPDNSKLYLSVGLNTLLQYDLSSGMVGTIGASRFVVEQEVPGKDFSPAKLELGPDGRVYLRVREFTTNPTVPYIQDPDLPGALCNFQYSGIPFPPNWTRQLRSFNLPSYIRGRSGERKLEAFVSDPIPCFGQAIKAWTEGQTSSAVLKYELQGQGDTVVLNDTLYIVPSMTGAMSVIATMTDGCGVKKDTINFNVRKGPRLDFGPDRLLCTKPTLLEGGIFSDAQYRWSDNSTNRQFRVNNAGTYWLVITDVVSGCSVSDTISLSDPPPVPQPHLGNDTSVCGGSVLSLYPGNNYAEIKWQDFTREPSFTTFLPGKYWVTVYDVCGNEASDTIQIDHIPIPQLGVPDELFFCPGKDVSIIIPTQGLRNFRWDDGPSGANRIFTQAGDYYLQAENSIKCIVRDTLTVIEYPKPPTIPLIPIDSFCQGENIRIDVSNSLLGNYQWYDSIAGAIRRIDEGGVYTVIAEDYNGCSTTASIQVMELIPPTIQIPEVIHVCRPDSVMLDATTFGLFDYRWFDGKEAPIRTVYKTARHSITAVDEFGCETGASVKVFTENCPDELFMPTAFTPDGNGLNEYFGPIVGSDIAIIQFEVYDRWGKSVFVGNCMQLLWDGSSRGQSCPEGVYIYVLSFKGKDGRIRKKTGTVTLIR
ncbi:MAG: gliding motility-associated C-terminal domain-containing protein, partial [Bacteroidia bacterium]